MYSQKTQNLKPSFIREILEATSSKKTISFAGGLPDPNCFPQKFIQQLSWQLLEEHSSAALQYGPTSGFINLKKEIIALMKKEYDWEIAESQILITSGSQQAMELIFRLFLDEGDQVIMENPGYLGALQLLNWYKSENLLLTQSNNGIDLKQLNLHLLNQPKLFYTNPTFQNPTGYTYTEDERIFIRNAIESSLTMLIEDDPYGLLYFEKKPPKPISSGMKKNFFYLGSFSKTIAPSMRIGFIISEPKHINLLKILKQGADLFTSEINQRIVANFLSSQQFEEHLSNIRNKYHHKMKLMENAIEKYLPKIFQLNHSEGGMFLWGMLPSTFPIEKLLQYCIDNHVLFVPGYTFGQENGKRGLRLNFTNSSEEEIAQGIKILGQGIKIFEKIME